MNAAYNRAKKEIMVAIEGIAKVKAPASEYLAALEEIQEEVEAWFEASIDAAKDDVKRENGE
jgi:hypothetical protein